MQDSNPCSNATKALLANPGLNSIGRPISSLVGVPRASRKVIGIAAVFMFLLLARLAPAVSTTGSATTTSLPLGGSAWGITYDSRTGDFYVANTFGYVTVVDSATDQALQNITFGLDPDGLRPEFTDIVFDNATDRVFAIDTMLPGVWVIDASNNSVVGSIPMGVTTTSGVSPYFLTDMDGRVAMSVDNYNGNESSFVLIYNAETEALLGNVSLPMGAIPVQLSYDPIADSIYVADGNLNETTVIDANSYSVTTSIPVPNTPYAVAYGGGQVFASEFDSNLVAEIDTSTNTITGTLAVPQYPTEIAYTSDPYVFAYGSGTEQVEVLNLQSGDSILFSFPNGVLELALAYGASGVSDVCSTYSTNEVTGVHGGIQCIADPLGYFSTTTVSSTTSTTACTGSSPELPAQREPNQEQGSSTTIVCGVKASPSISTALSANPIFVGNPVTDVATLYGGNNPTGSVTYYSYGNGYCTGTPGNSKTVTIANGVIPPNTYNNPSAGIFSFQAYYGGDANNNPATSSCEQLTVLAAKTNPSISTIISASAWTGKGTVAIGSSFQDGATLYGAANPTGSITFALYSNGQCSGPTFTTSSTSATGASVGVQSTVYYTRTIGIIGIIATYSGDDYNNPATSTCEVLTVVKASPTVTTSLMGNFVVGAYFYDTSVLSGGYNPTGQVQYVQYNNGDCTGNSSAINTVKLANGVPPESSLQRGSAGSWSYRAIYFGDANNNPATSDCEPLTVYPPMPSSSTTTDLILVAAGSGSIIVAIGIGYAYWRNRKR